MLLGRASAVEVDATRSVDHLGTDPVGSFRSTYADVASAFAKNGALARTVHHAPDERSGVHLLGMRVIDLSVHTWDRAGGAIRWASATYGVHVAQVLGEVDMRPKISAVLLGTAVAAVALTGCGSSNKATNGATSPTTAAPAPGGGAATVGTANVSGVGTVLVNPQGRTLYVLTSEKGNKVTCVSSNGCTGVWPPTSLPSGTTRAVAGSGVQASLLGTVSGSGQTRVTYASYPLYTYSGDTSSGVANGKGINSFGGTWWPISPAGALMTGSSSSASTTAGHSGY